MITNYCKNRMTLLLGGSITTTPNFFEIGNGSGILSTNSVQLNSSEDKQLAIITYPSARKIQFQGDWTSYEMSGLQLSEFGITMSGTSLNGSMWSITQIPSTNFDGTNELQIKEVWEVV